MPFLTNDISTLFPELFLVVGAFLLLIRGVYCKEDAFCFTTKAAMALLIGALILVGQQFFDHAQGFRMLVTQPFTMFAKGLILAATTVVLLMTLGYQKQEKQLRFEFPILVLFAVVGMMLMVSSNNLIALYMGLELQSLALYVLASFQRDSSKATEAGLKYFILGALSSGVLLYGASFIYGYTGTTDFAAIAKLYQIHDSLPLGVIVGLVMVIAALCFKISAVPFHMWTPDVYEGAPTPVTAFFAAAPKVAGLVLFIRLLLEPFGATPEAWRQIIVFISVASMLIGALAAIKQNNIKRLLAYSSIGHVGYALVGVATGSYFGVKAVLIYLAIYLTMTLGAFACVLLMRKREQVVDGGMLTEEIDDLAGMAKTYPLRALALAIFMLSMAGIPPFAGFFGKFYIFFAAVKADLWGLAVIGVLSSVISAYYYLRIIKVMYFDEGKEALSAEVPGSIGVVMVAGAVFNLAFFLYPAPLLAIAKQAARSLF